MEEDETTYVVKTIRHPNPEMADFGVVELVKRGRFRTESSFGLRWKGGDGTLIDHFGPNSSEINRYTTKASAIRAADNWIRQGYRTGMALYLGKDGGETTRVKTRAKFEATVMQLAECADYLSLSDEKSTKRAKRLIGEIRDIISPKPSD